VTPAEKLSRGFAHRPSVVGCFGFLRRGGGYDPRLRQMQINIKVLRDFYKLYDKYYTINRDIVKRKISYVT
jgi:hypothetical protein